LSVGLANCILRCADSSHVSWYIKFTGWTNDMNKPVNFCWLEDHSFAFLVASCTYIMRWLRIAHGFFKRIHDTWPALKWCKLIALLLCIPCFKAGYLFFKIIYFCQHRRILLEQRKISRLNAVNFSQQLVDLFEINDRIANGKTRLEEIVGMCEGSKNSCGCRNRIGHKLYSLKIDIRSCKAALANV
jgi:hypothetical protein